MKHKIKITVEATPEKMDEAIGLVMSHFVYAKSSWGESSHHMDCDSGRLIMGFEHDIDLSRDLPTGTKVEGTDNDDEEIV